jgi:hypothetical protein
MSLGAHPTPARAFPAMANPDALRARRVQQRRLIARVIPEVVVRMTVEAANVSGRWSVIEARARALEDRLDARDGRA